MAVLRLNMTEKLFTGTLNHNKKKKKKKKKNGGSMLAVLNFFNPNNFPIFQPILMKLVSKSMVYRALSYKTYLFWVASGNLF